MRTASYTTLCRTVLAWSGIGEDHEPPDLTMAIHADVRRARTLSGGGGAEPMPRGGALLVRMSAHTALLLCGSDHEDGDGMATPFLLRLPLHE